VCEPEGGSRRGTNRNRLRSTFSSFFSSVSSPRPPPRASSSSRRARMASSYVSAPSPTPSPILDKLSAALPFSLESILSRNEWTLSSVLTAGLVVVVTLLLAEQSLWRWRKQHLPGHSWQIVSPLSPCLERVRALTTALMSTARYWTVR
jgi:hypothetical protein